MAYKQTFIFWKLEFCDQSAMGFDDDALPGMQMQMLSCQQCAHTTESSLSSSKATNPIGLEIHPHDLI